MDRSYGLNAHVYYFEDYVRRRLESQSIRILCMADAMDWWMNYWQCDKYLEYGENWVGFGTYGTAAFRHQDKASVSFWDGHVEQMTADELKSHLKQWLDLERSAK
jgi:prepilin-type processing-associated H-X9-DG protein